MPAPAPLGERTGRASRMPGTALGVAWAASTCQRRPGPESRPRGAQRCSDRARAGHQAQDVRNTPGCGGGSQEGPPAPGTEARHQSRGRCPGPCIYSLTNNESHLFIPCRGGPGSGHLLEGSLAFLPPAPPGMRVPRLSSSGRLWCVPAWAQVSLSGSLDLQLPGGSALSSARPEHLGGPGSSAMAAPVSPCRD